MTPIPFLESMSNSRVFDVKYAKKDKDWQMLKQLYDENYLDKIGKKFEDYKIPKRIHQVWLGSELPEKYRDWGKTWKKMHPDWEYRLWTDKEARDFLMINRKLFDEVVNFGAKADIFRLEILYKYGGIYVDTDFECLKGFDEICKMTSFFTGIVYDKKPCLANGLMGVSIGNKIVRSYIDKLYDHDLKNAGNLSTNGIMENTGPYLFTHVYLDFVKKESSDSIPFPVAYFYPFPSYKRFCKDEKLIKSYIKNESMAIHYWSTSWVKKPNIFGRIYLVVMRLRDRFL